MAALSGRALSDELRGLAARKLANEAAGQTLSAAALVHEAYIALDEALTRFAKDQERKVQLVNLRYFVGLSIEEAAEALEISPATAKRDWAFAGAWLQRELTK